MKCPFCSHENTRVIDSRPAEDNNSIRRRRVCDECGKRFTTYEKIETIPLIIIKKDNNREAYDRAKIEAGVLRACHKQMCIRDRVCTVSVIHNQIEEPEQVIAILVKELGISEEEARKRVEKYSSIERVKSNVDKTVRCV